MKLFSDEQKESITEYIKSVVKYTLFSENSQNYEYDIMQIEGGFIFIPIYPVTYIIDEKFYNKLFTILNMGLTPMYTLIRPLTMQVITLDTSDYSRARGLFIPARKGTPKRLQGTVRDLVRQYNQKRSIPIMDLIDWNFTKAPHAVITGVTGSGKSYFLRYLFLMCAEVGEVIAVDPKGSDLSRLAKKNATQVVVPHFLTSKGGEGISGKFFQEVILTLKKIEEEMYRRQSQLYQKTSRVSTDYRELNFKPIFIFIDEIAALMTGASKSVRQDFQDTLTRLIILGREAGIHLVLSMQAARAEYIPTIVRDNIAFRVQLGRINGENSRFLFPELDEMPMVPLGGKGSGILSIAGDPRYAGIEPVLTPTILD